ncbi:MAG: YjjG family noncanonical pyrimidine nucleotidase [Kofleriaceae bacterium]|nr:YjjG family noncanonical pyrimidine nucleotidase [Kofleriaceae bacterium]
MRYTTLLLDLDHTLLDTDASEAVAFDYALRNAGAAEPSVYLAAYQSINRNLWSAVERGQITTADVRVARFAQLVEVAGIAADPLTLADDFTDGLGNHGDLYPGVREVLDTLAGRCSMALITNGLSVVQRARIARLDLERYFAAVVISSEVGCAKPATAIFDLAFAMLQHPSKASALMVGDSLTSDIQGGRNYGIATCWYNPHGYDGGAGVAADPHRVDHEIAGITQLLDLALLTPAI